ncbi:DUF5700 domain-containing putative Zn-dependent protease [Thermoflexibacter ruber]|uniref:DUF2268 domain-containing protein n=1 Tax=Thermoflexibacter ruber TaxID=1003 RepID=A0A1I2IIU9_9BACT|nr:DUF5700 domain-containing putative Zn-dependent protease [Thermoflexibacter ruber]SFF40461.1 hypothetical protein SAMN04488541_103142 [Thermoflexibacter ruber]
MKYYILTLIIICGLNGYAQKVETDISACKAIFGVLEAMKSGKEKTEIEQQINNVLASKAYQTMFQHYNRSWRPNHLPENTFKRMILSLKYPNEYTQGENQRADAMLVFWKKAFENIEQFNRDVLLLEKTNLAVLIQKGVKYAQKWLPSSMQIPDFYFFIHPNGGSPAFAINGSQGYDFFQLDRDDKGNIDVQKLIDVISHESHHLGLNPQSISFKSNKDSLAYTYLMTFVAEGTATKFVDNMPGGFVPKVRKTRIRNWDTRVANIWKDYTLQEKKLFERFESDLAKIYAGEYNKDSIQFYMHQYWLSGYKGRAYFLGAELFGAVYQAFGKKKLFYVMENPKYLLAYYNRSVEKIRLKNTIKLSKWTTTIF